MQFKNFDQLTLSLVGSQIIVRHKTEKDVVYISQVKHHHSAHFEKYNKNFFKILIKNEWVDLCSDVTDVFVWLDPWEDQKIADLEIDTEINWHKKFNAERKVEEKSFESKAGNQKVNNNSEQAVWQIEKLAEILEWHKKVNTEIKEAEEKFKNE